MPCVTMVVSRAITGLPEATADCTLGLILSRLCGITKGTDNLRSKASSPTKLDYMNYLSYIDFERQTSL